MQYDEKSDPAISNPAEKTVTETVMELEKAYLLQNLAPADRFARGKGCMSMIAKETATLT